MRNRIHEVLDIELPADALSAEEARELDAHQDAVRQALSAVRSEATPDLTDSVMRQVKRLPRHRPAGASARASGLGRLWQSFWQPREITFQLRPAWALAGMAAITLLVAGPLADELSRDSAPPVATAASPVATEATPAATPAPIVLVQFRLEAPGAQRVQLAGDFTDWQPRHTLNQTADGVWTIIVPVEAGVHEYGFVVDGEEWVADPLAPRVDDGFGGANSRLDVVATSARGL